MRFFGSHYALIKYDSDVIYKDLKRIFVEIFFLKVGIELSDQESWWVAFL